MKFVAQGWGFTIFIDLKSPWGNQKKQVQQEDNKSFCYTFYDFKTNWTCELNIWKLSFTCDNA